ETRWTASRRRSRRTGRGQGSLPAASDPFPASSSRLQPAGKRSADLRWKTRTEKSTDWLQRAKHSGKESGGAECRGREPPRSKAAREPQSCWPAHGGRKSGACPIPGLL